MSKKHNLYVISHTHWDREWYQTFQGFRKRLVFMLDELIEHMEANEEYKYFHMDGQTIVLEDYLEIRPENEKRLRRLIGQGRIIIGPWYVMPDEFLVSGESLIRNLQKGFEICGSFGVEPMKIGYIVDIFGHNSQFPQILKGFGIHSAILFRGIGDYPKDAFKWIAADGSSVLCIKLDAERGYSNFYFALRSPFDGRNYEKDELIEHMKKLLKYSVERSVSNNMVMLDGVDHMEIEPKLTEILSLLNENMNDMELKHSTLEEFVRAQKNSGAKLEDIKGELYNLGRVGLSNNLLKNVLSSMVHLKQANNECETLMTKWAEPFDAAASFIKSRNTKGFFKAAWKLLLQNHPHDSICGCSITPVHRDNEYRFNQARSIMEDLLKTSFEEIISSINTKSTGKDKNLILFNGSQKDFNGVVEVEIELPTDSPGNFKIFNSNAREVPYQLMGMRKGILNLVIKTRNLPETPAFNRYRVAFPAQIPAVGYNTYGYQEYRNSPLDKINYTFAEYHAPVRYPGSMQVGHRSWENEYLVLSIQDNGTLKVINKGTGKEYNDLLVFEDCADMGDGWKYIKPLMDSRYLSLGGKFDFSVENDGPFLVCIKLVHYMEIPVAMDENGVNRSGAFTEFKIITYSKMRKNSSALEFKTFIDNNVGEHRVRVLFPTYLNTKEFYTSTPFCIQKRNIKKPDNIGYIEAETGVYPNQGVIFMQDMKDSLGLFNKGLYEIEVTEDSSHSLALTLFRSFRNEVGRNIGEDCFMKRDMCFDYALDFRDSKVYASDIFLAGDAFRTGLKAVCTGSHEGSLETSHSFLKLNIPGAVLSTFKSGVDGMKIVRVFNSMDFAVSGDLIVHEEPRKVFLLNLNDEVQDNLGFKGNVISLSLEPAQIKTLGFIVR